MKTKILSNIGLAVFVAATLNINMSLKSDAVNGCNIG